MRRVLGQVFARVESAPLSTNTAILPESYTLSPSRPPTYPVFPPLSISQVPPLLRWVGPMPVLVWTYHFVMLVAYTLAYQLLQIAGAQEEPCHIPTTVAYTLNHCMSTRQ